MPQGVGYGPGPGATTPRGTGRASGAGPSAPPPSDHRIVTIAGELYKVPAGVSDEQIAEAFQTTVDVVNRPQSRFGESMPEIQNRVENDRRWASVISQIPSAVYGGMGMAGALKEPFLQAGSRLLGRAVPALSRSQAVSAVQRGGAPLLASSIKKLTPATAKVMQAAIPGRMGGSVIPELAYGGVGSWFGIPEVGASLAAVRAATRPLPLSLIAQGIGSAGKVAGPAVGAAGGGLAQEALTRLLNGRQ